jgi:hypothetical protein
MTPRIKNLLDNSMKEIHAGRNATELLIKSVQSTKQVIQESRELLQQSKQVLASLNPKKA